MVISELLTPELGVWVTPTSGGIVCVKVRSDTMEMVMTPLVV